MADDYQVIRPSEQAIEGAPRPRRAPEFPDDPDAARAEIEATRARMSETIDEIEDVLLRKKEQIQDRLDVFAPVRENPLPILGAALGAGLLLGLVTGGGDDEDDEDADYDYRVNYGRARLLVPDTSERAELWERRARRLLRIAREQEAELEALRTRGPRMATTWENDEEEPYEDDYQADGTLDELGETITDRLTGLISGLFRR